MEDTIKKKTAEYWTRKELEALPSREWHEDVGEFRALIILPSKRLHDSGYRIMDFVAVDKDNVPFIKLSGCSDVIHIDGIGGYGKYWINKRRSEFGKIESKGWNIDCLRKSGLLRIFSSGYLTAGDALSSFELFSTLKDK